MYAFSPDGHAIAADAATDQQKWSYKLAQTPRGGGRGMAFWAEDNERRLIVPANFLIYALDPETGLPIPSFGKDEQYDEQVCT